MHVLKLLILVHTEVLQQDSVQRHAGLGEQRQLVRTVVPEREVPIKCFDHNMVNVDI